MTLEEANKIVNIWGKYLECISGKLAFVFGSGIPESFLPFPKDTLLEASNIMAEYHHNNGDKEKVDLLQGAAAEILAYKDDEEAIIQAAKFFNDPNFRKIMLSGLKEFQNTWIKMQRDS